VAQWGRYFCCFAEARWRARSSSISSATLRRGEGYWSCLIDLARQEEDRTMRKIMPALYRSYS